VWGVDDVRTLSIGYRRWLNQFVKETSAMLALDDARAFIQAALLTALSDRSAFGLINLLDEINDLCGAIKEKLH
jgi:hypothetical protein